MFYSLKSHEKVKKERRNPFDDRKYYQIAHNVSLKPLRSAVAEVVFDVHCSRVFFLLVMANGLSKFFCLFTTFVSGLIDHCFWSHLCCPRWRYDCCSCCLITRGRLYSKYKPLASVAGVAKCATACMYKSNEYLKNTRFISSFNLHIITYNSET